MPRPLQDADLSRVRALLADVDGTMTVGGALESRTLKAVERLCSRGVQVVLVTGRPAGWGECWARTLPVRGVVVENGGLYFVRDRRGLRRVYLEPRVARRRNRRRLLREVRALLRRVPGARLSSDSAYTEVDLAIDYNEEARLPRETADWMVRELAARGVRSARSSVHVNCWLGPFDKLVASERFVRRELHLPGVAARGRVAYVGDSLNDAPMFGAVPLSIGVANVREVLDEIDAPPRYITRAAEGRGFEELASAILEGAVMMVVRLELARGLARHLRGGHPWVFKRALEVLPKIPPGSVVDLTEGGKFVARGYFDPHSAIAVRVLTLDSRDTIDAAFFRGRVGRALAQRKDLLDLTDTDSFRLIHGEGDGLPGVIVDLYAGFAVLKLYSAGLTPYRPIIVEALAKEVPGLKGVIGRDEIGRDDAEGEDDERGAGRILWGEPAPDLISIRERGATFLVDAYRGQKTGFFLDQRENRFLVRGLSRGRTVLNCFSYSGGFSVNAALGGATSVFSVDLDADAVALSRENFSRNGLKPEQHDFLAADVFKVITSFKDEGRTFDLVILDPPAFAKSQRAVEAALDGYASLNRQALALLKPGGLLATASCSARVTPEDFFEAVKAAGQKVSVELALVEERYQPPDHPVKLAFKEGKYLKFFVLRVR